jgi:patatin-like phospholipase/acyl hydrolase
VDSNNLNKPIVFSSKKTNERSYIDALMASTASPTFFSSYNLSLSYRDGGILANNPSKLAYEHAIPQSKPGDMFILNLGTGDYIPDPY